MTIHSVQQQHSNFVLSPANDYLAHNYNQSSSESSCPPSQQFRVSHASELSHGDRLSRYCQEVANKGNLASAVHDTRSQPNLEESPSAANSTAVCRLQPFHAKRNEAIEILELDNDAEARGKVDSICDASDSAAARTPVGLSGPEQRAGRSGMMVQFDRARKAMQGLLPNSRRSSFHLHASTIDVYRSRARRLSFIHSRRKTLRCSLCAGTALERAAREVLARLFGICEHDLRSGRPASGAIYPHSPFSSGNCPIVLLRE